MIARLTRRQVLQSTAAIGAATMAAGAPRIAFAARDSITVRNDRDIQSLDPARRIGTVEGNILRATQPRLTMFEPATYQIQNDAAESIEQVDETTIAFKLKPGIKWQGDYGQLTTEDVKFSFERFNNPAEGEEPATYAKDWAALDHVEIIDELSGKLILKNPAPALWLIALSDVSGCIVCKKAWQELGGEAMKTRIVGAGPYLMTDWQPNQSVTLTANPDYYGPQPPIREVVLRPIAEPKTAQLAFLSDEVQFTKVEDPAAAEALAKAEETEIIKKDSINYVWIGMNVEKPPLDNPNVREAIRKALDVDAMLLAGFDGTVGRAKALLAPGLLGNWADAPTTERDIEGAKTLLAEAGFPDGFPIRLTLLNKPYFQTMALVAQANLAEVGIDVQLEVLDGGTYWSMGEGDAGKNLELSMQRFGGKADPSFQTQWFTSDQVGSWNWQRWKNEEFDRLNTEAESTTDEAKRADLYVQMQKLMEDSNAYVWLTHEVNVFATKDWLDASILPNGDDWQYRYFKAEG
jgi:peptide/nickel transport system substrate-binding protein